MKRFIGSRLLVALLVALAIGSDAAFAQSPPDEAQIKAAFMYNFLKFVEWPNESFASPGDSIIVGIVGGGATAVAAAQFLDGKPVNGRTVAIRRLKEDGDLTGVHAVFIGDADAKRSRRMLAGAARDAVLSIGESADFALAGGVIGLLIEAQKVRFEINNEAASGAHLKISSKLLALAKIVRSSKSGAESR